MNSSSKALLIVAIILVLHFSPFLIPLATVVGLGYSGVSRHPQGDRPKSAARHAGEPGAASQAGVPIVRPCWQRFGPS